MKKKLSVTALCVLVSVSVFILCGCGGSKLDKAVSFNGKITFSIPQDWQQTDAARSSLTNLDQYSSADGNSLVTVSTVNYLSPEQYYIETGNSMYKNINYKEIESGKSSSNVEYQIYSFSGDERYGTKHIEHDDIFVSSGTGMYSIVVLGDEVSASDIAKTLK